MTGTMTRTRTYTAFDVIKRIYYIMLKDNGRAQQDGDSIKLWFNNKEYLYVEEFTIDSESGWIKPEGPAIVMRLQGD